MTGQEVSVAGQVVDEHAHVQNSAAKALDYIVDGIALSKLGALQFPLLVVSRDWYNNL